MAVVFNIFTGNFDFTGTSGGGGGSISGSITTTQVAYGTGVDTIGGSTDFTWDGTTATFTAGHGLSFAGTGAPTTMVGGDDGQGDSAVTIDNADGYVALLFPSYTDIVASDVIEFTTTDFLNQITLDPAVGVQLLADAGKFLILNGTTKALDVIGGPGGSSSLHLKPAVDLANVWSLESFIHSGDTDRNVIHSQQYARTDHVTNQFESGTVFGAVNAGGTTKDITSVAAEGHFTSGGVLSDYTMYWYDHVVDRVIFQVESTFPNAVQFNTGISLVVPGVITAESGVILGDASALKTDTTTAHTGLIQAYDVDGAAYATFGTLTNGNTPSFALAAPAGGTLTGNYSTLQVGGVTVLTASGSGTALTFPGTLSIASGKTLTASNTLTLTGTDSSSIAFGAGGTVLYSGGALGTPSSGTLTNCTGLPVGSITGLGTGVATWLATPSSANLATAITDETGSGALVFGTGPTISGATLSGATTASGASSLIVPTSAGYAPTANGSIGFDSTQNAWSVGGAGGVNGHLPRVLQAASAQDTLTASVINTVETAFATTFTIPSGLLIANKVLRVTFPLQITTSGTPVSQLFSVRLTNASGTQLFVGLAATPGSNLSGRGSAIAFYLGGTAAAGASVNTNTEHIGAGASHTMVNTIAQPVAIATNSTLTGVLTMKFSGNTAGNSVTVLGMIVEELN